MGFGGTIFIGLLYHFSLRLRLFSSFLYLLVILTGMIYYPEMGFCSCASFSLSLSLSAKFPNDFPALDTS